MAADTFRLRVEITIEKMAEHGGYTGERLTVREELDIPANNFTEVAGVLGQFHELAGKVKAEHVTDADCAYFQAHSQHHAACCPIGRRTHR